MDMMTLTHEGYKKQTPELSNAAWDLLAELKTIEKEGANKHDEN